MVREGELLNELWRRRAWARPALEHALAAKSRPVPAYAPPGAWWAQPYAPHGQGPGAPAPAWNPYQV